MKLICILLGVVTCFSAAVSANKLAEDKHFKDLVKKSIKCSVVLVGGKTTVLRYYNLPVRDRSSIENEIKVRGVNAGNKHYSIHKVKECINFDKKFKDAISQQVDTTTANSG